MQINARSMQIM